VDGDGYPPSDAAAWRDALAGTVQLVALPAFFARQVWSLIAHFSLLLARRCSKAQYIGIWPSRSLFGCNGSLYAMHIILACGRQDPGGGCPFRSGVERELLLTQVWGAGWNARPSSPGRGCARVVRWRNPGGRLRDPHESCPQAGSSEHERQGMEEGDGAIHAQSQVAPDLKGARPEPTRISLALTSAGPLSRAAWQALSKTPPS